jgi:hypothetical protein
MSGTAGGTTIEDDGGSGFAPVSRFSSAVASVVSGDPDQVTKVDPAPPADPEGPSVPDRSATVLRRFGGPVAGGLAYVIGAVALFWNVWSNDPTKFTQIGGDTYLNTWLLNWTPYALVHGHNPFFSTYANYPFGVNTLANTSEPLLGLVTAPVTWIWGPITSFNVLMTAAIVLSAGSGYLFARRWVSWKPAAFAGGLLYGFSPYMTAVSDNQHIHLSFAVFPPLIFLALDELLVRQRHSSIRWGVALAALLVAQFFVSSEVLFTTIVIAGCGGVVLLVVGRRSIRDHAAHALVGLVAAGVITVVVLTYPVWFALYGPGHIAGPTQLVPQAYRADLLGAIQPDSLLRFAPSSLARTADHFANDPAENGSYLGIPLVVALIVTVVWLRRRPVVVVTAVTGLIAFILSLGGALALDQSPAINGSGGAKGRIPLPETLLGKTSLLKNTIPSRFSLYVALFASLLLAIFLEALYQRWTRHHRSAHSSAGRHPGLTAALVGLIGLVALVPMVPVAPFGDISNVDIPPYFLSPAVHRIPAGSVAMLYPYPSALFPNAQVWQAEGGMPFKMPGAYLLVPGANQQIAFSPTYSYSRPTLSATVFIQLGQGSAPPETPALRSALLAQMRSWHVQTFLATMGGTVQPAQAMGFITWLLGQPTALRDGTYVWSHLDLH